MKRFLKNSALIALSVVVVGISCCRSNTAMAQSDTELYDMVWRTVNTRFVDQSNNGQNWSRWRYKYDNVIIFSYNAATSVKQVEFINAVLANKKEVTVISLKGPMDFNKYNNLNNYLCLYEYTPNSIRTVVKYLKQELEPVGKLTIKL